MASNRAVFFDRDNTIIHDEDGYLGDPAAVRLIRGSAHAIASLRQLGYRIVVATNQSGVARGYFDEKAVDAVHQRIAELVHETSGGVIDRFYYCPFHPDGVVDSYAREHPWRKPQPGMLLQAAEDLELSLEESWFVGDAERDIEAGRAAGCQTVLVSAESSPSIEADFTVSTIAEAAAIIAQNRNRARSRSIRDPIVVVPPRPEGSRRSVSAVIPACSDEDSSEHQAMTEPLRGRGSLEAVEEQDDHDSDVTTENETATVASSEAPDTPIADSQDESSPASVIDDEPDERRGTIGESEGAVRARQAPASTADRAPAPPRSWASRPARRPSPAMAELVSEFRSWRHAQREFTPFRMLMTLALLAVLVLSVLAALYMEPSRALAWIGVAVVTQATIIGLSVLGGRG
ncbi:MAG: HAD-IIIA family hydrolase [Phycisphaerales bacterium]